MTLEGGPSDKLSLWSHYCHFFFNLVMAPCHIPLWRFFYDNVPPKTPRNNLHFFSQLKFDGEGETSACEHAFKSWKLFSSHNIADGNFICRLFTLTFAGWVKSWCDTLSGISIHMWEQFIHEFLHNFENYDYDQLCE
jgi:hypothetical protein